MYYWEAKKLKRKDKQVNLRVDQNSNQYRWLMNQKSNTKSINILINLAINTFGYGDIDEYFDNIRNNIIENAQFVLPNTPNTNVSNVQSKNANADLVKNNFTLGSTNSFNARQENTQNIASLDKDTKSTISSSSSNASEVQELEEKEEKEEKKQDTSSKTELASNDTNKQKRKEKTEKKHELSSDEKKKKINGLGIKLD